MDSIQFLEQQVNEFLVGEMGIQQVLVGDSELYKRKSSYCYILLETEEDENG